jgi:hypothetical protein
MSDWWPAILLLTMSVRPALVRLASGVPRAVETSLPLTGKWLRSFLATAAALLLSLLIPLGYVSGMWLARGMDEARSIWAWALPVAMITARGYYLAVSWTPGAAERRERWLPIPREYLARIGVAWLALLLAVAIVPMAYTYSSRGHQRGWSNYVPWKLLISGVD